MDYHGVGEYARDSWMIFVEHRLPDWEVGDKELRAFLEHIQYDERMIAEAMQWRCDHPTGKVSREEREAMSAYVELVAEESRGI
jgi:hypothetical protein